jgi:hypothetical protein
MKTQPKYLLIFKAFGFVYKDSSRDGVEHGILQNVSLPNAGALEARINAAKPELY